MENKSWTSLDAVKALAILVVVVPLARYLETDIGFLARLPAGVSVFIMMVATYLVIAAVILYFTRLKYRADLSDLGLKDFRVGRAILLSILWFLGLRVVIMAYGWVVAMISPLFHAKPPVELSTRIPDLFGRGYLGVVLAVTVAVILGPFIEELFFRGFLYPAFRKRLGPAWAIFVSSLIFGIFHVSPWLLFPTGVMGAALAYLYETEDSLGPPFVLHSLNNLISIIIVYSIYGT